MKSRSFFALVLSFTLFAPHAWATQADDTTITIDSEAGGPTALIFQLTLSASDTTTLQSIDFSVASKPGSVVRPFSQSFTVSYLTSRGYLDATTGKIYLPVYGLYAEYDNTVTLTYSFLDGSSKQDTTTITTGTFKDPCGISTPTILTPRTSSTDLSYDYMLVRGACGSGNGISPVILDTDGAVRWISPFATNAILTAASTFFDHAVYITEGSTLSRVDFDGTVTPVGDYADMGVINFHHQIDPGSIGMILDADTDTYAETVNMEVDAAGTVVKTWNLADIISAAMTAGGDDPSQFVYPTPTDWWHNNSVTYRLSDNSLVVSSREDFVIALDYNTDAIKWILGDETKKWFQFPSLAKFSLALGSDTLPPIGQHALSFTYDDNLLLMDNGRNSQFQDPMGINRTYSAPRKYDLNLTDGVATEVWNYTLDETVYSQFCGSIYEDAPLNYLIDYAFITATDQPITARLIGLEASGEQAFDYQYPTSGCNTAYNSIPLHAEHFSLSTAAQALNLSTRGIVLGGDNVLIGGFILSGFEPKNIVLRAIGPSLADHGVSGVLPNPVLTLYDSTGAVVATNDDWADDASANTLQVNGLAPADENEAAILKNLAPGAYTVVVTSADDQTGIALVEAYDLSRNSDSDLGNISTRGFVENGDNILIAGFIIGTRNSANVVLRALGPSLADAGVQETLNDPKLTIHDSNGVSVGVNDNWQDDPAAGAIQLQNLAPANPTEAATLATLAPGSYTVVVQSADGATGIGLVEVYNLP
ncbi:MAG: aryl-sulfate sulfotransferase [Chthoniobacterales bacterium]